MKKLFFLFGFLILILSNSVSFAQVTRNDSTINLVLDEGINGKTFNGECSVLLIAEIKNDTSDYFVTFCSERPRKVGKEEKVRMSVYFESFGLDTNAFLTLYNGADTLRETQFDFGYTGDQKDTMVTNDRLQGHTYVNGLTDSVGCITIRFYRIRSTGIDIVQAGLGNFKAKIECIPDCQIVQADLDSVFYKYSPDGSMKVQKLKHHIDTAWSKGSKDYFLVKYRSVDFCLGDSIVLVADPKFPENNNRYSQNKNMCIYKWDFGDGVKDSVAFKELSSHKWIDAIGYNLNLRVIDTNLNSACYSRNTVDTRIRIAKSPIKVINSLPDICSGETFKLNVGFTAENVVLLDTLTFPRAIRKSFPYAHFLPDIGCGMPPPTNFPPPLTGLVCVEAQIDFDKFAEGATLTKASDLLSICFNMEHSSMDQLAIYIICPNGSRANLKKSENRSGAWFGEKNDDDVPCMFSPPQALCNPELNPPGVGWLYCWSEQYNHRGYCQGDFALSAVPPTDTIGRDEGLESLYFLPVEPFNNLVGCPLNGQWLIRVCQTDICSNGWIFWSDIEINSSADFTYQVPVDSIIFDGPFTTNKAKTSTDISIPVSYETKELKHKVSIVDKFECVWDTVTSINVVQTPVVNLGKDTSVCETVPVVLDAKYSGDSYSYIWEPNGDTTKTITIIPNYNSNKQLKYSAQVTNTNGSILCSGNDSLIIKVNPVPTASFSSSKYPIEGCEPLDFQLLNTSSNASSFNWTVGQHTSTNQSPTFRFENGSYDVKLKVISDKGCTDSIEYKNIVNVYKSPKADFSWEPIYPSTKNPSINFINQTSPKQDNSYHWSIQTDKTNTDYTANVLGDNPSFRWTKEPGKSLAGDYIVTLNAASVNKSQTGFTYECHDTISKVITIINDNLMFPNVVTPNGDGVNDIFIIHNLISGQAFPNNELTIYDRTGKQIFHAQNIRNEKDFWDPAKTNTPAGTYFYRFIGKGPTGDTEYKGSVEVLR